MGGDGRREPESAAAEKSTRKNQENILILLKSGIYLMFIIFHRGEGVHVFYGEGEHGLTIKQMTER